MLKMPGLVHDKSAVTLIYVSYTVSVSLNIGMINIFTHFFIPMSRDHQYVHFDKLANQHCIGVTLEGIQHMENWQNFLFAFMLERNSVL